MRLTKTELIERNELLLLTMREMETQNRCLTEKCQSLQARLRATESELTRLSEQYRKFTDYVRQLRLWILTREGG